MKIFYAALLLCLIAALMVLEVMAARVPVEPMTPAREAAPRASALSAG